MFLEGTYEINSMTGDFSVFTNFFSGYFLLERKIPGMPFRHSSQ